KYSTTPCKPRHTPNSGMLAATHGPMLAARISNIYAGVLNAAAGLVLVPERPRTQLPRPRQRASKARALLASAHRTPDACGSGTERREEQLLVVLTGSGIELGFIGIGDAECGGCGKGRTLLGARCTEQIPTNAAIRSKVN